MRYNVQDALLEARREKSKKGRRGRRGVGALPRVPNPRSAEWGNMRVTSALDGEIEHEHVEIKTGKPHMTPVAEWGIPVVIDDDRTMDEFRHYQAYGRKIARRNMRYGFGAEEVKPGKGKTLLYDRMEADPVKSVEKTGESWALEPLDRMTRIEQDKIIPARPDVGHKSRKRGAPAGSAQDKTLGTGLDFETRAQMNGRFEARFSK